MGFRLIFSVAECYESFCHCSSSFCLVWWMIANASLVRWSSSSRLVRKRVGFVGLADWVSGSSSQRSWLSQVDAHAVYCMSWSCLSRAYFFAPERMVSASVFLSALLKASLASAFPFLRG